jgi:hypothetical protein
MSTPSARSWEAWVWRSPWGWTRFWLSTCSPKPIQQMMAIGRGHWSSQVPQDMGAPPSEPRCARA